VFVDIDHGLVTVGDSDGSGREGVSLVPLSGRWSVPNRITSTAVNKSMGTGTIAKAAR
jgi:hypothetical protein